MQRSSRPRGLVTLLMEQILKLNSRNRVLEHEKKFLLEQLQFSTEQFKRLTGKNIQFIEFSKIDTGESSDSSDLENDIDEDTSSTQDLSSEQQEEAENQPQQSRQVQQSQPFTITLRRNRRQPGEFKELLQKHHNEECKCRSCQYEKINQVQTRRPKKLMKGEQANQEDN